MRSGFSLAAPLSLSSSTFSSLFYHSITYRRPFDAPSSSFSSSPSSLSLFLSRITLPIPARGGRLIRVLVAVMHAMLTNLFLYVSISCLLSSAAAMSAYEVLKSHGLPMGLLPKGVKDFRVDGDGLFDVQLEAACTARFESQSEVRFNSTVSGTLSYGQIAALSGVSAQELFLWFPVRGIRVDIPSSGLIYFDVGVIYKRFSLSLFETPPDCIPFSSETSLPSKDRVGKLRFSKLDQEDARRPVL